MTELEQFLQDAQNRGAMTLSDHLTEAGFTTDFNQRKSMEFQVVRAITDNPRHQSLRGTIIFPSDNTRAAWADGIERRADRHERPKFVTSLILARNIDPILSKHEGDWHYTGGHGTAVAVRAAVAATATLSKRKQDVVATAWVRQNDELDWVLEDRDRAKERIADLIEERDHLRSQLDAANAHISKLLNGAGRMQPTV